MLPIKFKSQMVNFSVHICNPTKINAFMSTIDQGNEIVEHITFKRGLLVIEHAIHIPFTYFNCCYELQTKNPLIVQT
jgi:hypothetical protein